MRKALYNEAVKEVSERINFLNPWVQRDALGDKLYLKYITVYRKYSYDRVPHNIERLCVLPYMCSVDIVDEIIRKFKPELDIIFGGPYYD